MGECQSSPCCYSSSNQNLKPQLYENSHQFLAETKKKYKITESTNFTLTFDNRSQYTGQLKDGNIRHGYGTQKWQDGAM